MFLPKTAPLPQLQRSRSFPDRRNWTWRCGFKNASGLGHGGERGITSKREGFRRVPAERTAAASVTAVPRSLASAISPAFSGALLASSFAALPLLICASLKIIYDLSLLFSFRQVKPPEERET